MAAQDITTPLPKRMQNRKRPLPPVSDLLAEARRLFRYDQATGNLIRIAHKHPWRPGHGVIGEIVGGDDGHGYRACALFCHKFKVHQIVWLMCTGDLAAIPLDHINRNRRDNRIENLRLATDQQNLWNSVICAAPLAGTSRSKKRWRATITISGSRKWLGNFVSREDAAEAYRKACRELRGEFAPT